MATAYARGRSFEYRTRDYLTKLGYVVCRSPQSRSPYDLIAVGKHVVMLVQCKVDGRLDPKEWNELYAMAHRVNAVPVLVDKDKKRRLGFWQMHDEKRPGVRKQPKTLFIVPHNDPDGMDADYVVRRPQKENARAVNPGASPMA